MCCLNATTPMSSITRYLTHSPLDTINETRFIAWMHEIMADIKRIRKPARDKVNYFWYFYLFFIYLELFASSKVYCFNFI